MSSRMQSWAMWAVPMLALSSGQPAAETGREARDRKAIEELHRQDVLSSLEAVNGTEGDIEIVDYRQDWRELTLAGNYAFEWGYFEAMVRVRATGELERSRRKVMRILWRSGRGGWRVYRTVWSDDQATREDSRVYPGRGN